MLTAVQARRRRLRRQRAARGQTFPRWPFVLGLALLLGGGVAATAVVGHLALAFYQTSTAGLRDPAQILAQDQGPAIIYDRAGNFLYEYEDKTTGLREPTPLDAVSPWLVKATIATEDPSFYTNPGVNRRGFLRAACEYVHLCHSAAKLSTGGSGITQQLVKLLFEPPAVQAERSVSRKLKEAAMALALTRKYNKNQILEWYLNTIYYGNRADGIGAAAKIYFGKKPIDLDLAEASLLAGIPASPGDYDPIARYTVARQRQREVLDLMIKHGAITQEQADQAYAEPLDLKEQTTVMNEPHWVNFITQYLTDHCQELIPHCTSPEQALYHMGLRITTTLDSALTDQATAIVDQDVTAMEKLNCQCHNGAAMVIDNNTGQILAMVGSRDYYRSDIHGEVNNTLAVYQPGSALKPAVYLAAFLKGWSPGTLIDDTNVCYPNGATPFCPSGPTLQHVGPLPARVALGSSMNSPAVQTAAFDTVPGVLDVAHRMGITTMPDAAQFGVAIATGGSQVTLYDMTYMYSTIANNGDMRGLKLANPKPGYRQVDPVAVLTITDRTGKAVYQFRGPDHYQAEPAPYVYEISNILQDDAAKRLTYSPGLFDIGDHRPIAAKTGTQQGETVAGVRATWNFGYIPDLTVGVWVGNADGAFENPNLLSATSSLMVWKDIMKLAVQLYHIPPKNFVVPAGIARGLPTPPGARLVGCGIQPDIYVVGQPVSGPPLVPGQRGCSVGAVATPASSAAGAASAGRRSAGTNGDAGSTAVRPASVAPTVPPAEPVPAVPTAPALTQTAPPPTQAAGTGSGTTPPSLPPAQPQPPATQPSAPPPPAGAPTVTRLRCPPGLRLPPGVSRATVCQ